MLGFPPIVLKFVSISYSSKQKDDINNTVNTSLVFVGIMAAMVSILLHLFSYQIAINLFKSELLFIPLKILSLGVIPFSLRRILCAALKGYRKIWQSGLFLDTLNMIFIALILCLISIYKVDVNIEIIAQIYLTVNILVLIIMFFYWFNINNFNIKFHFKIKSLLKMALPMLIVSSAGVLSSNLDSIMLGGLGSIRDVGLYNVATRLSSLTLIIHVVVTSAISPIIASLWEKNKTDEIEFMAKKVTKIILLFGLVFFLIFILFGEYILLLWGKDFLYSYTSLVILSFSQLSNMGTGVAHVIMMMTGHEKKLSEIVIITLFLNIILNFILIPVYGSFGASLAFAISIILQNILKFIYVTKKIGVSTL